MSFKNPDKYFPELAGMPLELQQEIVERARYQTFIAKGSNERFMWRYVAIGLFFLVAGVVLSTVLRQCTTVDSTVITFLFGGSGPILAMYLQQRAWMKQIHPTVQKLAQQYKESGEDDFSAE